MAATHIRAYRQIPDVRISALYNPSGRRLDGDFSNVAGNIGTAEELKMDMTHVTGFRSFLDMLSHPELDLVDICAPTAAHPELAMAALRAGKHVLCEKPMARNAQAAQQIAEAAADAQGFFMPAMCLRFWPEWAWLKQAIEERRFGRVLSATFRRVAEPPAWGHNHFADGEKSGGALLDLHIHDVDFIHYCFGRPRSVYARGYTKFSGAIDHVIAQYETASAAMVTAEGGWAMTGGFGFNMSYTVNFERATADYDLSRGANSLRLFHEGNPAETITCAGPDGFVRELQYMVAAIQENKRPTVVTARDGLTAVEICEAEEESIRSGGVVRLS